MQLQEIMQGIELMASPPDMEVTGLTHDSRQVTPGNLFVALSGQRTDGTKFMAQAVANGAIAVVGPLSVPGDGVRVYIGVNQPRSAYSRMAANFYRHPSRRMTVVGITGTNGKTTTAELVAAILRAHRMPAASLGTLGLRQESAVSPTGFTTPEAGQLHRIFSDLLDGAIQAVVMEVSSHALDQHRVDDVDFDAAAFTNLTREHLDYHQDMDAYLAAKLRLFKLLAPGRPAVVNVDDPAGDRFIEVAPGPVITYSLEKPAVLQVVHLGLSLERTIAILSYQDDKFSIESSLVGAYNLENLLAATAIALALGVPPMAIQAGISTVKAVPGRLERIPAHVPGAVFIDYAHTPDAYEKVLGAMHQLAPKGSRMITLFGCGGDRDRTKRPLMAAIAEARSDQLIITSDNPRTESLAQINGDVLRGLTGQKHVVIEDRQEALVHALGKMTADAILMILGKGRENYQIIGTEKIPHDDVEIVEMYRP